MFKPIPTGIGLLLEKERNKKVKKWTFQGKWRKEWIMIFPLPLSLSLFLSLLWWKEDEETWERLEREREREKLFLSPEVHSNHQPLSTHNHHNLCCSCFFPVGITFISLPCSILSLFPLTISLSQRNKRRGKKTEKSCVDLWTSRKYKKKSAYNGILS